MIVDECLSGAVRAKQKPRKSPGISLVVGLGFRSKRSSQEDSLLISYKKTIFTMHFNCKRDHVIVFPIFYYQFAGRIRKPEYVRSIPHERLGKPL
jgi:hypothetical protein